MKTLGTTNTGHIVEMTDAEMTAFWKVQEVASGVGLRGSFRVNPSVTIDSNMVDALKAIALWVEVRFRINDLEQTIAGLKQMLGESVG